MSSNPLTEAKEQLLAHGPNFAISPMCLPTGEYIAAFEQTYLSLAQKEAEELVFIIKVNIFLRPEEAMLKNWQKLSSTDIIFCFLRKLNLLQL